MAPVLLNPSRFGGGGTGSAYADAVLADTPLAYYRLGEPSGTTMTDSSGNGRDGTYTSVTLGAASLLATDANTAATFPGSGSSVASVAYASWMDAPTATTVEAWIKTTASGTQAIIDRDDGSSQRPFQFRLNGSQLEFVKISSGVVTAASTGLTLNNGSAHHVVATYDGSDIRLYADGALVKTQAAPGSLTGSRGIQLGRNAGSFAPFNGTIDEAAYYGAVLSGTRIAAHYAAA